MLHMTLVRPVIARLLVLQGNAVALVLHDRTVLNKGFLRDEDNDAEETTIQEIQYHLIFKKYQVKMVRKLVPTPHS